MNHNQYKSVLAVAGVALLAFGCPDRRPRPAPQPPAGAEPSADAGVPDQGGSPVAPPADSGTPAPDAGTPPPPPDAGAAACARWSDCGAGFKCVQGACVPFHWSRLGPGGGGTQSNPRISPLDARVAMVNCDMTGAYLTRNGGDSWDEFNVRTLLGAAAFDPTDPNVIYAGSTGIFRSENGGRSFGLVFPNPAAVTEDACQKDAEASHYFRSTDNWPGGWVNGLAVDPQNNQRLYAVIDGDLWVSGNRGANWSKAGHVGGAWYTADGSPRSVKIFVDPTTALASRGVYFFSVEGAFRYDAQSGEVASLPAPGGLTDAAFGLDPSRAGGVLFYAIAGGSLYRSVDRGQNWQSLGGPSPHLVATATSDARTVWVSGGSSGFGVLRSDDSGGSFAFSLHEDCSGSGANYQSAWLEAEWTPCWPGPAQGLAVAPNDPGVVIATDSARTYGTYDGGGTWKALYSKNNAGGTVSSTGLDVTTAYGVHVDPFDPAHLVISYTDIGMFQSFDHGASWKHAVAGVPGGWLNTSYWMVFDPAVKGRAWSGWASSHDLPLPKMWGSVGGASGGVARTEDGLGSWASSSSGLSGPTTHLELDPTSPAGTRTLYATVFTQGVYKSVDDGRTWSERNAGITQKGAWTVVRSPNGKLYYVAAYFNGAGALYQSADGAASWQPLAMPTGVAAPRDLVVDPKNPSRLYLTCWTDGDSQGGVYATDDAGLTWRNVFDPRYQVYSLAIDPRDSNVLWITTFWGQAFRSDDAGKSWLRLAGFDFKWGHRPIIDPGDNDSLFITTFGSSVWHGP